MLTDTSILQLNKVDQILHNQASLCIGCWKVRLQVLCWEQQDETELFFVPVWEMPWVGFFFSPPQPELEQKQDTLHFLRNKNLPEIQFRATELLLFWEHQNVGFIPILTFVFFLYMIQYIFKCIQTNPVWEQEIKIFPSLLKGFFFFLPLVFQNTFPKWRHLCKIVCFWQTGIFWHTQKCILLANSWPVLETRVGHFGFLFWIV